jgi:hypothetical protein
LAQCSFSSVSFIAAYRQHHREALAGEVPELSWKSSKLENQGIRPCLPIDRDFLVLRRVLEFECRRFVWEFEHDNLVRSTLPLEYPPMFIGGEQSAPEFAKHASEAGLIPLVAIAVLEPELRDNENGHDFLCSSIA